MTLKAVWLVPVLLAGFAASAQDAPRVERIEVTGSNVKRVDHEGATPLLVLRREEIARSAGQNLQDILINLPIANTGSLSESNNSGIAGVSLRGLGTDATLVLLNGRRLPVHGFANTVGPPGVAFVNLNAIPVSAIERIEVLKDGASAIYGSDAIAGVINIILRKDFRGAELYAGWGESSRHDAAEARASLTLGSGDLSRDGYNVMATFDYHHRDALEGWQRERSRSADQRRNGGRDLRQPQGRPGTWLTTNLGGFATNTPFPECAPELLENGLSPRDTCAFDQNTYLNIFPRTNRKSAFARGIVAVTPRISAFLEGSWNDNRTALGAVPTPDTIALPVGHNSNPYAFPVSILHRWSDVGRRFAVPHTVSKRIVAGVEGETRRFDWQLGFNRAVSDNTVTHPNQVSIPARDALVAANLYDFVNAASNDSRLLDALRVTVWRSRYSKVESWDAKVSGPVYEAPAGAVLLALGAEHRNESLASARDSLWENRQVVALSADSHEAGQRRVNAAFGEMIVPLAKNIEAQLAIRRESYSDYGSSSAPKLAAAWRPVRSILLRASHAQGFRAPSFVQLYTDLLMPRVNLVDAPRCNAYTAAFGQADPRRLAVCASQEILTANGGNPNLRAEQSKGDSLGVVLEPAKGLTLNLDFYRIRYRQRISSPSIDTLLANEDLFPGAVVRDAPGVDDVMAGSRGPLVGTASELQRRIGIYQYYYNAATVGARGLDLDLRYRVDIGAAGTLQFESLNAYIDYLRSTPAEGQPEVDLLGVERAPRYRGTHALIWKRQGWAVSATANVIGSSAQPVAVAGARGGVASWTTLDLQATHTGWKHLALTVGVRNALDREPPFYNNDPAGFDTATHSLIGRFYYFRVVARFG